MLRCRPSAGLLRQLHHHRFDRVPKMPARGRALLTSSGVIKGATVSKLLKKNTVCGQVTDGRTSTFTPPAHNSLTLGDTTLFLHFSSTSKCNKMEPWTEAIEDICWQQRPSAVLGQRDLKPNPYLWFPDGKLNTCYNSVDRHALTSPNTVAIHWHSAATQSKLSITYQDLLMRVKDVAGMLADYGVKKGDTVVIYMPMILEAVYTMLACARLGAVHSVVFGK